MNSLGPFVAAVCLVSPDSVAQSGKLPIETDLRLELRRCERNCTDEQDGTTATAAEGLVAVRGHSDDPKQRTPTTIFGKGKVRVESSEWIVDGNDGFRLREVPLAQSPAAVAAEKPSVDRFIRLGPARAGRAHAYRIERLPPPSTDNKNSKNRKAQPLVTTGTGACDLWLRADGSGTLRLESAAEDSPRPSK